MLRPIRDKRRTRTRAEARRIGVKVIKVQAVCAYCFELGVHSSALDCVNAIRRSIGRDARAAQRRAAKAAGEVAEIKAEGAK